MMGAGVLGTAASIYGESMQSPLEAGSALTFERRMETRVLQGMGGALMMSGNPLLMGLGAAATAASTVFGFEDEQARAGANAYVSDARRYGQLSRQMLTARNLGFRGMGGGDPAAEIARRAAAYGMTGEEGAGAIRAFQSAAGTSTGRSASRIMQYSNLGLNPGALGQYAGLRAAGVGGIGGSESFAGGIAYAQGLRGSKVEEYLSVIASGVKTLGEQGLQVDVGGMESFLNRMRAGDTSTSGLQAARATSRMMGAYGGAREMITAPFQSLARMKVLQQAMQGASGPVDVLQNIERLSRSKDATSNLTRLLGQEGDAGVLALAGFGFDAETSARLASGDIPSRAGGVGLPGDESAAVGDLAREALSLDFQTLITISKQSDDTMRELNTTIQEMRLDLMEGLKEYLREMQN